MDLNAKENFENEFRVQLNRYQWDFIKFIFHKLKMFDLSYSRLEESDLFLPSFVASFKMHGKFSALDFYYLTNGSLYKDLVKIIQKSWDFTVQYQV